MEVYFQLVTDAESLKAAVANLRKSDLLGFDTETTELDPYKGELRLVQISDGKNTQVIDLRHFGSNGDLKTNPDLAPLRDLLSDKTKTKVAAQCQI